MADETEKTKPLTIRLTDTQKAKLDSIAESVGSKGVAIEMLISAYEAEQAKQLLPDREKEINTHAVLLKQLHDMYISSLDINFQAEQRVRTEFASKLDSQQRIIEDLQQQIASYNNKLTNADERVAKAEAGTAELQKSLEVLEEAYNKQSETLAEATNTIKTEREYNETLKAQVVEAKHIKDNYASIKKELEELRNIKMQHEVILNKYNDLQSAHADLKQNIKETKDELKAHYTDIINKEAEITAIKLQNAEHNYDELMKEKQALAEENKQLKKRNQRKETTK